MARPFDCEFRRRTMAWRATFLLFASGLGAWSGVVLTAQSAPASQDAPIHTLHVYTNLIQIPTLVLQSDRERIPKPIAESRFSVSLDNGPWFRATHVRLEGDDAISLSILLDVNGDTAELMPKIGDAIGNLAPLSLHPKDRISIYVMDCTLVRSWNDISAASAGLKVAVNGALQSWTIRTHKKHAPKCQQSVHLWDVVAHIVGTEYNLPGRRVVLVVSDGRDRGSGHSWNEVRAYATAAGVAVFGMTDVPSYAMSSGRMFPQTNREDPFQSLCELSGGLVLSTNVRSLAETLRQFTTMLRERYIVEFPRPAKSTAGSHEMQVKIAKDSGDFIRSAGIGVPLPDAAVLADPTTVPSDPTLTPELGTRSPIKKPR
jgi:hypothetical protein